MYTKMTKVFYSGCCSGRKIWLTYILSCTLSITTTEATTTPPWVPSTTTVPLGNQIQPINLSIVSVTSTSLTISWQHSYDVSSLGVRYSIKATSSDTGSIVTCALGPGTRKAVCTGITPGNRYQVMVTATSGSVSRSETQQQYIDPGQPGPLTNSNTYLAPSVTLHWGQAPGKVDFYILFVNGTQKYNGSTTSCSVTGLKPGTLYPVTIQAYSYNRAGTSRTDIFTTQVIAPDPPTGLKVKSTTTTSVELTWQPPQITGGTLTGYWVCHSGRTYLDLPESAPTCTHTKSISSVITYRVTGLTAGGFYTFDIYTVNTQFNSTQSASTTTQTEETVPGSVTSLKVMSQGEGSLHVSWQRPSSPNGNITGYQVAWTKEGYLYSCSVPMETYSQTQVRSCVNISTSDQKNFEYLITNLKASTNYNIAVTAFTARGQGTPKSFPAQTSVEVPGNVTNVQADVLNANSIKVTWVIPGLNPGPTNYTATAEDASPLQLANLTRTCTATGYTRTWCTIGGLQAYWQYNISVRASTAAGSSGIFYADGTSQTQAGEPGPAQDLKVQTYLTSPGCDARRVTFKWSNPDPLARNALINSYKIEIYNGGASLDTIEHFDAEAEDHVYSNRRQFQQNYMHLSAEDRYTWKVISESSDNLRSSSSLQSFSTEACAPPKWGNTNNKAISSTGSTSSSVTVSLDRRFFDNHSQGNITELAIILARTMAIPRPGINNSCTDASIRFSSPYKIHLYSSDVLQGMFKIGAEDCQDKEPGGCCNGPLPEGFTFYVRGYVCTRAGCTVSPAFGPFSTQTSPEEGSQSTTIAVAVIIPLVVVIGLIILVLLVRRGTIHLPFYHKYVHPLKKPREIIISVARNSTHFRSVLLEEFPKYLEEMHKQGDAEFAEQYEDIQKLGSEICTKMTTDHSHIDGNMEKNRWTDILPFDDTRVKLKILDNDPTTDYINANYIPGYRSGKEYIATQGPLRETVRDFWRMVWEHKTAIVVMLVRCQEGVRTKCEQYWPSDVGGSRQYGDLMVTLDSKRHLNTYNVATMTLSWQGRFLTVTHFHFLGFPDFSADVNPYSLIQFVKVVRNSIPCDMSEPIVVHCSGGVGQTGTFIAVDRLYQNLEEKEAVDEASVDIFGIVVNMRERRVNMVQTESQYILIHECFQLMLDTRRRELGLSSDLCSLTGSLRRTNSGYTTHAERDYENMAMIRRPSQKQGGETLYMNVRALASQARNRDENTQFRNQLIGNQSTV